MERKFRVAARAYFVYGVIYWLGGTYLIYHGVGVNGSRTGAQAVYQSLYVLIGLILIFLIPYLLRHPRGWFDRWILSRRDFARLLALFMAFRAYSVGKIALHSDAGSVPAPWGGIITFQAGAVVFFLVTVAALAFVGLAAWGEERG